MPTKKNSPRRPLQATLEVRCKANAHLKRTMKGREVVVVITAGRLDLGPGEQILYGEFDGKWQITRSSKS